MKLSKKELVALSRIEREKAFHGDSLVLAKAYRKLEAQVELLSKKYYSAFCTKCGYMRPATEIEKENDALRGQIAIAWDYLSQHWDMESEPFHTMREVAKFDALLTKDD